MSPIKAVFFGGRSRSNGFAVCFCEGGGAVVALSLIIYQLRILLPQAYSAVEKQIMVLLSNQIYSTPTVSLK